MRANRIPKAFLATLLVLLMLLAASVLFISYTERGTRLLVHQATEWTEFLSVNGVGGTLGGQVVLRDVAIKTESTQISLGRVKLQVRLADLLRRRVTFSRLHIGNLEVVYSPVASAVIEDPIRIAWLVTVEEGRVSDGVIRIQDDEIRIGELNANVTLLDQDLSLEVEQLSLLAPQALALSGGVGLSLAPPYGFEGDFLAREILSAEGLVPDLKAQGTFSGSTVLLKVDGSMLLPEVVAVALQVDLGDIPTLEMQASAESVDLGELTFRNYQMEVRGPLSALAMTSSVDIIHPTAGVFHGNYRAFFDQRIFTIEQLQLSGDEVDLSLNGAINTVSQRVTALVDGEILSSPLSGSLDMVGGSLKMLEGSLRLQQGDHSLLATARPGKAVQISGSVFDARVSGEISLPEGQYKLNLDAAPAVLGEWRAADFGVIASGTLPDNHLVTVKADSLFKGDLALGSGSVDYAGTLSSGNASLQWEHPAASLQASGQLSSTGSVRLTKAVLGRDDVQLKLSEPLDLLIADAGTRLPQHCWQSDEPSSTLCFSGLLSASSGFVEISSLVLETGPVALSPATGRISYRAEEQFELDFNLAGQMLVASMPGERLNLRLSGTYENEMLKLPRIQIESPGLALNLTLDYLPASSRGEASITGKAWNLPIEGAGEFTGSDLASLVAAAQLESEGLGKLVLNIADSELNLQGDMHGLQTPDILLERAVVEAKLADWNQLESHLDVAGLVINGVKVGGGQLVARGDLRQINMDFKWLGIYGQISLASQFSLNEAGIDGRLQSGQLSMVGQSWSLDGPVLFHGTDGGVSIANHCWRQGKGSACFSKLALTKDLMGLSLKVTDAPIDYASLPFAPEVAVDGLVAANVDFQRRMNTAGPVISGSADIAIPALRLRYYEDEMIWSVQGSSVLANEQLSVSAAAMSGDRNRLDLDATVPALNNPERFLLSGTLTSDSLSVVTAFVPLLDRATGSVQASVNVDTRPDSPLTEILVDVGGDASVAIPAAGVMLDQFSLAVRGDSDVISLDLSARSGAGTLTGKGTISDPLSVERKLVVGLTGQAVTLLDRPEVRVVASPDLLFEAQGPEASMLSGSLSIDSGYFRQADFGSNVRWTSPDVVVVSGSEAQTATSASVALQLALSVEAFDINLYGLAGEVQGDVMLTQQARKPRRAVGELNLINGSFSRYGQEFDVARGRLIFAGSLTNPSVDIVSTRTITDRDKTVKVSLNLTGPANNIRSTIVSSPAMSEASALSYLIIGRSLSTATTSDGSSLTGAAVALGLRRVAPVTDEIRSMLGLSELTLETGVDSTTVIAGKQFGSALYVVYSYDMLGRIGGILFNYQLSDRLSLETRSGEDQSMQLIYTFD